MAVIYDPFADEMFWAIQKRGSFLLKKASELNGNKDTIKDHSIPIRVSETSQLSHAVISMDPGYARERRRWS